MTEGVSQAHTSPLRLPRNKCGVGTSPVNGGGNYRATARANLPNFSGLRTA